MGTTYKSILFVFFTVLLCSGAAKASGDPCDNPKIQLSQLNYVGLNFSGQSKCVKADDDQEALRLCRGFRVVNPNNPQYGAVQSGDRAKNPDGYYYCIAETPTKSDFETANPAAAEKLFSQAGYNPTLLNDKRYLCTNVANSASPWRDAPGYENLVFTWRSISGKEGDCYCGLPGNSPELCDQQPPSLNSPAMASVANANPAEPSAASVPVSATTQVTPTLNSCVQNFLQAAESCKAESERAKRSCDERNNSNVGNNSAARLASGATQIMGQIYNMQNQASGMQAECFRAGAVANTASTAIGEMKRECEIDFSNCNRLCKGSNENESKSQEFQRVCSAQIGKTSAALQQENSVDGELFRDTVSRIDASVNGSVEICTVEAGQKRSTLSNLADGIGRALQSSVQCACQTSSAGVNCQNIPPVQDCTTIPQPAGCGAYDAMATCSVGSASYNAKECTCMQNPRAPGCGGGSNAVSAFSGPAIANNLARGTAGGGNFSGGAGGGKSSGISLGGNGRTEDGDLSFLGAGKAGGAAAANNSVGGGGAPGTASSSNGNATEDKGGIAADDGGIGGMFNQAKTFMSRTLGLDKKPTTSKSAGNGAAGKPDMGKFKPLRGLAGRAGGMGSRNMDIWKMMNACTSGDTCKSNENNYLITP